jgi:ATP-binding cassette subfamily F protein 3
MIQLDRVAKSFGGETLFEDLSWQIGLGRRIGLIGPNGAGKTTLFRLLTGEIAPDAGRVVLPRGTTVGMLPQDVDPFDDRPLLDVVLEGRSDLLALERRMAELQAALTPDAGAPLPAERTERLAHRLGEVQERYAHGGGYSIRPEARAILSGMGFQEWEQSRSAAELSGGWRVRLALSRLLLQRPDLLLMDEPTNHLDVPSLEWLEGFLADYEGTIVVVSHDRYFLNHLVNEIAAVEIDGFHTCAGDYDAYQEARRERLEQLRKARDLQDRKLKETRRFIERFRYKATKARQVQSRIKQLEKVERIEIPGEERTVSFRFPEAARAGQIVCRLEGVSKAFDDTVVYTDLDFQIQRGERVALVGPNGGGKSTLLKLIAGDTPVDGGRRELGHQVAVGYYAQHQVEALDLSKTLLEELQDHATLESRPQCRSILGAFLFSGDEVEKKITVLSGGERSRVALAKLLLQPTNLLLLDEPTNHLDIASRDVLTQALQTYGGTLLFVSHDRRFINALATRVVHVEGGRCLSYPGDYEYYRFKRQQEVGGPLESSDDAEPAPALDGDDGEPRSRREQKRIEAERRNRLYRQTRPLREALETAEHRIADNESRIRALEREMADPALYDDPDQVRRYAEEHAERKARLAGLYDTWAELAAEIEAIEARAE